MAAAQCSQQTAGFAFGLQIRVPAAPHLDHGLQFGRQSVRGLALHRMFGQQFVRCGLRHLGVIRNQSFVGFQVIAIGQGGCSLPERRTQHHEYGVKAALLVRASTKGMQTQGLCGSGQLVQVVVQCCDKGWEFALHTLGRPGHVAVHTFFAHLGRNR